jgi:protein-disulfide isomerase
VPASGAAAEQTAGAASTASSAAPVTLYGVDLTGIGHDVGDPSAPVTVVEFSDFGCPFCAMYATQTLPVLQKEFIEAGKVFYKHVPFVMGMFPNGDQAARAAECAAEQDAFWPMHDRLYAGQRDWKGRRDPEALFREYATALKLDVARFSSCYRGDRREARLSQHNQAAGRLGIRATPTFFINGQQAEGALPLDVFRSVLEQMSAK